MSNTQLRPWQKESVQKSLAWLLEKKQDRHFLMNAAPGSGKTICASVTALNLIQRKEIDRVIVIAPLASVVKQWAVEFQNITGRHMAKITGADIEAYDYGVDLCATWHSVSRLLDIFQGVCRNSKTLIICDEHHHAAVSAAWGTGANGAFKDAKYVLVLTGTPMRSDGDNLTWFAYTEKGRIEHPDDGTFTLTYGEAVELGYCRPITFNRHFGQYNVDCGDGEIINVVSGKEEIDLPKSLKKIPALQNTLQFYRLACRPKYKEDGVTLDTEDTSTYQASMLKEGIAKLDEIKCRMPKAGGLVIAPNIKVAEYMAGLLKTLTGETPVLVHNDSPNSETKIDSFRNSNKNWIVSVEMISEGVDIKRLRVLVFLPRAKTELFFRQAMGRIVRNFDEIDDDSFPQVIMPNDKVFDLYAKRVEKEMPPSALESNSTKKNTKICPTCSAENPIKEDICLECGDKFPERKINYKTCDECNSLNPASASKCQSCGNLFENIYHISIENIQPELIDHYSDGDISCGVELTEAETLEAKRLHKETYDKLIASGHPFAIKMAKNTPPELYGVLSEIFLSANRNS